MRTKYDIIYEDQHVIALVQTDPTVMSITNDAEAVIADLLDRGKLHQRRVIYKDTEGRWDELVHWFGEFKNYKFLNAKRLGEALAAINS